MSEDEWQQRFTALLQRRASIAARIPVDEEQVAADVADAVGEVQAERARASGR